MLILNDWITYLKKARNLSGIIKKVVYVDFLLCVCVYNKGMKIICKTLNHVSFQHVCFSARTETKCFHSSTSKIVMAKSDIPIESQNLVFHLTHL